MAKNKTQSFNHFVGELHKNVETFANSLSSLNQSKVSLSHQISMYSFSYGYLANFVTNVERRLIFIILSN